MRQILQHAHAPHFAHSSLRSYAVRWQLRVRGLQNQANYNGLYFRVWKKQIVRWEEKKNTALKGGPHETINIAAAKLCTSTRKHIVTKYDVHIRKVSLKIYNLSSLTSCTWHTQKMTKYDVCIILHEPHENNSPCTLHASTCAETSSCLLMLKSTISLPFRLNARCCMGYGRASTSPKPAKVNY